MNPELASQFSEIAVNCLWQAACLTLITGVAIFATRQTQLALRKLILCLTVFAWLAIPIWNLMAVPLNWHLTQIALPSVESRLASPETDAELIPIVPGLEPPTTQFSPDQTTPHQATLLISYPFAAIGLLMLLGVVVGLSKHAVDELRIARFHRELVVITDSRVLRIWDALLVGNKNRRTPGLFQTAKICSPISTGCIQPRIILPIVATEDWSDDEILAALSHEYAHWRHHDLLLCHVQRFARILFWWNPMIAFLNRELNHVQELICDTYAINNVSSQTSYASLLVRIAEGFNQANPAPMPAVGMARNISSLEQRIRTITSKGTNMKSIELKRRNVVLACLTACCLALPIFGVQLAEAEDGERRVTKSKEVRFKSDTERFDEENSAEIIIKRNGRIQRIHVPLNNNIENARIKDFLEQPEHSDLGNDVRWIEKRKSGNNASADRDEHNEQEIDIFVAESDGSRGAFTDENGNRTEFEDHNFDGGFGGGGGLGSIDGGGLGSGDVDVFVRKRNPAGNPFGGNGDLKFDDGTERVIVKTDDGEQVIELRRRHARTGRRGDIAGPAADGFAWADSGEFNEDIEIIVEKELARAQEQIRRSEQQIEAAMQAQIKALEKTQKVQQQKMQEMMRQQQLQMEKMMKQMQLQLREINRNPTGRPRQPRQPLPPAAPLGEPAFPTPPADPFNEGNFPQ